MSPTPPLRVMLVDDHQVVREGIKLLLADLDDVVVCAEASTAREAVATAARALPDVVVMDVRLQDGSGIEATRDLRAARPQTAVLMLTSFADDEALFASIMAGAAGYVPQADPGRGAGPGHPGGGGGPAPAGPGGDQGGVRAAAPGQAAAPGREAGPTVGPGGTHPLPGRRGPDQPPDRRRAGAGREDGQELCVGHPGQAGGRPPGRGRRLPGPPHHPRGDGFGR